MSRYPDCALTRYLAENRLSVGLIAGSLLTSVKPRLIRSCLIRLMNGPRLRTTCPLLTLTELPPCPDRALTSCSWTAVLAWTQTWANCGLVTILCTWP